MAWKEPQDACGSGTSRKRWWGRGPAKASIVGVQTRKGRCGGSPLRGASGKGWWPPHADDTLAHHLLKKGPTRWAGYSKPLSPLYLSFGFDSKAPNTVLKELWCLIPLNPHLPQKKKQTWSSFFIYLKKNPSLISKIVYLNLTHI